MIDYEKIEFARNLAKEVCGAKIILRPVNDEFEYVLQYKTMCTVTIDIDKLINCLQEIVRSLTPIFIVGEEVWFIYSTYPVIRIESARIVEVFPKSTLELKSKTLRIEYRLDTDSPIGDCFYEEHLRPSRASLASAQIDFWGDMLLECHKAELEDD